METTGLIIGQKVVCIDDKSGLRINKLEINPVKNTIYTVREIYPGNEGIRLVEIINRPAHYKQGFLEIYFRTRRFAPIETIEQSEKWAAELIEEIAFEIEEEMFVSY